ncbi:hypothetical protein HUJ05_004452 [Dendroctonus ponderosae]|nr:hypothetical protein HUJ05_004452 [Dendroctonus ponderosae]
MGRRSINTTKSGKYMNPTDQARKEARKQELKKNKKQRQMVRAAVLKGKDPQQILEEMEKIDQMEFNVNQPSPLNEKVLKDKRKKLRDTLDRVLGMYYKDDQDKWSDLKKRQSEYEAKKSQLVSFYESVKTAQSVTVDDIPLPQLPQQNSANVIPLPNTERKPEVAIYSIATALKLQALGMPVREPPGCPPGPPPNINDDGEVDEYFFKHPSEEQAVEDKSTEDSDGIMPGNPAAVSKPTSLQQKMVALSGQNVDEFMKEMETVQKKLDQRKEQDQTKLINQMEQLMPPGTNETIPSLPSMPATNLPPSIPPPLIFSGTGIRLPPGPPPGRPLMPPGPPPGLPPIRISASGPRLIRIPVPPLVPQPLPQLKPNVLSAAPQLINRNDSSKHGATISAKPQIRNLSADVTRFVPSALRVKREERKNKPVTSLVRELKQKEMNLNSQIAAGKHTKDDAYKQFMEEMEGLMYHKWMKSEELQRLTASEPLTLEEEYEMQKSWQKDNNKCTFIILDKERYEMSGSEIDAMIGDTNLFFATPEDRLCAEAEIMIAESWARGRRCGWEGMLLMIVYAVTYLDVKQFVVKISCDNLPSISLFQSIGFIEMNRSTVFQEITFSKLVDESWIDWIRNSLGKFDIEDSSANFPLD